MALIINGTTQARAETLLVPYLWGETEPQMPVDSNRGYVMHYLSTVYAPYLVIDAVDAEEVWAFLELDDAEFNGASKVPTEDYLDQILLETGNNPLDLGPRDLIDLPEDERIAYFRENIVDYASLWSDCQTNLGTYGYTEGIPQVAVKRAMLYDSKANKVMTNAAKEVLTPTMKNFAQAEQRGIDLTSWFFQPPVFLTLEQYMGDVALPQLSAMPKEETGKISAGLRDYSGLTILSIPAPPEEP